ncbi:MAG: hypothetical protein ACOVO1_02190 [Chitinophagaceae bacterium]
MSIINCSNIFSQDSTFLIKKNTSLKRGIYFTYESFCKNQPNISDSFSIEKNYKTDLDDNIKSDSSFKGYVLKLTDSTKKIKKVFGIYDGENLYIDIKRGLVIRFTKQYTPFDYIGKFPFIEISSKKPWTIWGLGIEAVIDDAISNKKPVMLYINKDGELSEATNASIWFFLKKDKEILKEYEAEKVFNINTFRKYLIKMNEKYASF